MSCFDSIKEHLGTALIQMFFTSRSKTNEGATCQSRLRQAAGKRGTVHEPYPASTDSGFISSIAQAPEATEGRTQLINHLRGTEGREEDVCVCVGARGTTDGEDDDKTSEIRRQGYESRRGRVSG